MTLGSTGVDDPRRSEPNEVASSAPVLATGRGDDASLFLRWYSGLALELPPCLFPYIRPEDPDWRPRYDRFNRPGDYHNGGVWPFICGFYVAACVAAGRLRLARERLEALTEAVRPWRERELHWGFNEWLNAQTGRPSGRDWQTWSASMYLYATVCVERETTPFFDWVRSPAGSPTR
ncbi:MAG: glycoside hydrolase 100 family protein [Acidobacteria bacterium]|nr:glycoside hydrolase 100 family protein [Acidobacteriota bacterium]